MGLKSENSKEHEDQKSRSDFIIKKVRKRDGRLASYSIDKIEVAISKAALEVGIEVDVKKLASKVEKKLLKEHKHRSGSIIPDVEEIQDFVEETLLESGYKQLARSFIIYRERKSAERSAKNALIGKKIFTNLSINALRLLKERYLLRDEESGWFESPDELFERVARFIAKVEKSVYGGDDVVERRWKNRFKRIMKNLDFLPNSACLMNAGTEFSQLASSIAIPITDSLEGIYRGLYDAAVSQQRGSGTGFDFSNLRPKGSIVKGRLGTAAGPLRFLMLYNDSANTILQAGKRQGANMAMISVNHPDVLDFVTAKTYDKTLENFNISILLNDDFIKAAVLDRDYSLLDPISKKPVGVMSAKQVFDIMVATAWNQADPGILFKDRLDADNPLPDYRFCATSPCAEMFLSRYEQAFLGAINLSNFVDRAGKDVDWRRLKDVIGVAVRFLDDMIDASDYSLLQAEKRIKNTRKIGLGVMGLAHMLIQLDIPYNSEEALSFVDKLMAFIRREAENASMALAEERGVFPAFDKSIYSKKSRWFKADRFGNESKRLRNASLLAISPTGSRSMIADTSSSIEPLFALSYVKKALGNREFKYLDPYLRDKLIERGIYSDELVEKIANFGLQELKEVPEDIRRVFVTTYDISPEYHVKMQAVVQKHVDNAVSKTVNLPANASLKDVENVFLLAYKHGCKGCTIYRDGSKSDQVYSVSSWLSPTHNVLSSRDVRSELKVLFSNKSLSEFGSSGKKGEGSDDKGPGFVPSRCNC